MDHARSNYILQIKNWDLRLASCAQTERVSPGLPGLQEVMLVRRTHHLLHKWRLKPPSCKHEVELSVRVPPPLPPVRRALRVGTPPLHSYFPAPGSESTPNTGSRNTYRMNQWIIAANATDHLLWARLRAKHHPHITSPNPTAGEDGQSGRRAEIRTQALWLWS